MAAAPSTCRSGILKRVTRRATTWRAWPAAGAPALAAAAASVGPNFMDSRDAAEGFAGATPPGKPS